MILFIGWARLAVPLRCIIISGVFGYSEIVPIGTMTEKELEGFLKIEARHYNSSLISKREVSL